MAQANLGQSILVGGMFEQFASRIENVTEAASLRPVLLGAINAADITCGYAYIDNDVCVSTVAIVGQYLRALQEADEPAEAVLVAELCRDCRSVNLKSLARFAFDQAGFDSVRIVELSDADLHTACPAPAPPTECVQDEKTAVGIFGPAPVLLTPEFNKAVIARLEENGLMTVMPPLAHLLGQRDVFEPAVKYFIDAGIAYAIGIIPFGCMSGNVYARGRLRTLQKLYPSLQITLIDYDPSASDINTINRTELVIQSIFDE